MSESPKKPGSLASILKPNAGKRTFNVDGPDHEDSVLPKALVTPERPTEAVMSTGSLNIPAGMTADDVMRLAQQLRTAQVEEEQTRFGGHMPNGLYRELQARRVEERRTLNNLIIRACRLYLKTPVKRKPRGEREQDD